MLVWRYLGGRSLKTSSSIRSENGQFMPSPAGVVPTSTVGRGRAVAEVALPSSCRWSNQLTDIRMGDSIDFYSQWDRPTAIFSDGGYGILGFEGDTSDHLNLPQWYEAHIRAWSEFATPETTLWFWNSEIGWAAVHPVLEKYGWRYVNANIWNKGKAHIAGNVNTKKIRRFPVVSEVCVQYVFEAKVGNSTLKEWLLSEWLRAGLPRSKANEACGVKNAASRKYLDQGHLWYFPPPEVFELLQKYANAHGCPSGRPYFSLDGKTPASAKQWSRMRAKFKCPHGFTNIWDRSPLHSSERYKIGGDNGKAIHLNQKPLDLTLMVIEAVTDTGDVVWEPFGGLFTACVAAGVLGRKSFGAEIDPTWFHYGRKRVIEHFRQQKLL